VTDQPVIDVFDLLPARREARPVDTGLRPGGIDGRQQLGLVAAKRC
jgi:hypothetical protein